MPCTVHNIAGFAHKTSGGMSMVFPDVCKTPAPPAPPVPIPYPNIGKSSDTDRRIDHKTQHIRKPLIYFSLQKTIQYHARIGKVTIKITDRTLYRFRNIFYVHISNWFK